MADLAVLAPRRHSVVTRMEIEYGLLLNPARAKKLASITVLPFEDADAIAVAAIRAALHQRGQPIIGAYDIQIAGCSMARGLVMMTSNEGEFRRVSGLQVTTLQVSWPDARAYPWNRFAFEGTAEDDPAIGDALQALRRLAIYKYCSVRQDFPTIVVVATRRRVEAWHEPRRCWGQEPG